MSAFSLMSWIAPLLGSFMIVMGMGLQLGMPGYLIGAGISFALSGVVSFLQDIKSLLVIYLPEVMRR